MSSSNAEGPVAPRPVEYVDYDSNYPSVFELLDRLMQSVLPGRRVEHIGSTSVPGLGGRPVLDSVVVVPPDEHASAVESLERVGFKDFPHGAVRPGLTRSLRVARHDYAVVVYVIAPDHDYLRGWLAFTSYMREHPDAVERYAAVKRAALAEGHTDPRAYQEAKTPFLQLMQHLPG